MASITKAICPSCGTHILTTLHGDCPRCGLTGDEIRDGWKRGMGMHRRCYACGGESGLSAVQQQLVVGRTRVLVYFCGPCAEPAADYGRRVMAVREGGTTELPSRPDGVLWHYVPQGLVGADNPALCGKAPDGVDMFSTMVADLTCPACVGALAVEMAKRYDHPPPGALIPPEYAEGIMAELAGTRRRAKPQPRIQGPRNIKPKCDCGSKNNLHHDWCPRWAP